jgi:hypothetical protein
MPSCGLLEEMNSNSSLAMDQVEAFLSPPTFSQILHGDHGCEKKLLDDSFTCIC